MTTSNVYSHVYGKGPLRAVGLHGWAGAHHTYEALERFLPPGCGLLAVDMPGYGASPDPEAWTVQAITDRLLDHVAMQVDRPCTLVGNCSGAVIAMHMAKTRPELFERLVLVEPFAFAPWYFRIFLLPLLGRFFYWNAFKNPLGRWIVDRVMGDQANEGRDLMEGFDETRPQTALSYLDLVTQVKDPMFFAGIKMPVELVFGDQTMEAVKTSIGMWRGVWPRAGVYQVDGAGHLLLQESPDMVGGILQASCATWSAQDSSSWSPPG